MADERPEIPEDDLEVLRTVAPTCDELLQVCADFGDALTFYADPETYHAIAVLCDRPCGAFEDDIQDDHNDPDYGPKPGARARQVLDKHIVSKFKPKE